jgi:hypothetical protein
MNVVIIVEIVLGLLVLVAAVRFAVRDTRQRCGVAEPGDTGEVPARGGEGEEVAALSAPSTAPESHADAR